MPFTDRTATSVLKLIDVRMTQLGIMKYEYTSLAFLSENLITTTRNTLIQSCQSMNLLIHIEIL